jgi:hypothetical protein
MRAHGRQTAIFDHLRQRPLQVVVDIAKDVFEGHAGIMADAALDRQQMRSG